MPNMIGVELAKVGKWDTSTGSWSPTAADFAAAVAAQADPAVPTPVVKLGHTDPRFDGEPALGSIRNLRTSPDGNTLIGDLLNLPGWLHQSMASSWPNRSVEASLDVQTPGGTKYPLVIDAVALLGVVPPAVKGLADLPALVAASRRVGRLPAARKVAASMTTDPTPYVTPLVEKIAAAHNVNLRTVTGTGVGGRIRKSDVEKAAGVYKPETVSAAQSAVDTQLAQMQRDLAPFAGGPRVSAAHASDPNYRLNPLVDDVRRVHAARAARASSALPTPTLFVGGSLPAFTASGIPPEALTRVPWQARHQMAAATTHAEAYEIAQRATEGHDGWVPFAQHEGNRAYEDRVNTWQVRGMTDFDLEHSGAPGAGLERARREAERIGDGISTEDAALIDNHVAGLFGTPYIPEDVR